MRKLDDEVVAGTHLLLDRRPEIVCLVERARRGARLASVVYFDGVGIKESLQIHAPSAFGSSGWLVTGHSAVADSVDLAFRSEDRNK